MSPFRLRHSPSASPHPPTSPDLPPHASSSSSSASTTAPPSRIPVSRSTSSLTLFRTRSRGNELDEVGVKGGKEGEKEKEGSASPEWTIRAVTRRRGSKQDDADDSSPQRAAPPLVNGQEPSLPPPASHPLPHPPPSNNKLSKWLSRSTSSASAVSNFSSPPPPDLVSPTSPTPTTKTRTTRSRSIGSLNLLSRGAQPYNPASASEANGDASSTLPPPAAPPPPPSISISSSPSTDFSTSSPPLPSSSSPPVPASTSSSSSLTSPPPPPPAEPIRRASVASTSTTKSGSSSLRSLGLGGGGLKVRTRKSSKAKRDLQLQQPSNSGTIGRRGKSRGGGSTPPTPSFSPASFSFSQAREKEQIDDWSTADLSSGDEQGRIISEQMVRAVSRGSTSASASSSLGRASGEAVSGDGEKGEKAEKGGGGGGVLAKSLRRTRSGLRLFGGGGGGNGGGGGGGRSREGTSGSEIVEAVYGGGGDGGGAGESAAASVSPTPTSASFFPSVSSAFPAAASSAPQQTAAGRIGGWFSSMLHGSGGSGGAISSTHLPLPSSTGGEDPYTDIPAQSSPEKSRSRTGLFSSASPSSPGSSLRASSTSPASPQKKASVLTSALSPSKDGGSGRLGAFDRILDRAAQYFFDSDSKADECTEEIWVLGVRHAGHVPAAAEGEGEVEEEGEEGGADEKGKKRRSLPSLGRKSRLSPVKGRKNAPSPSVSSSSAPPVPALPSSTQGDPFLVSPPSSTPAAASGTRYSPTPSSASLQSHHSTATASSPSPSPSLPPSPSPSPSLLPQPAPAPTTTLAATTIHGWPPSFYHDFYSRIALTYRTGFPLIPFDPSLPIPTPNSSGGAVGAVLSSLGASIGRGGARLGGGGAGGGGEEGDGAEGATLKGLNSDTGWGCMLRTGQSLLANALGVVHLGRDWRRPLPPSAYPPRSSSTSSSSSTHLPLPSSSSSSTVPHPETYARLLSLFLDVPSPSLSPFSVHAFAHQGRLLGKAPGEWFGPSTAAGAIKALVNSYEPAGLKVVSCIDGAVYESEVREVSKEWEVPVLVLVNVRLGIDGVNPIYHEAIKGIFRLPQTVGIAGGRPSSSYYFVGAQANSLFYIDPHHPRPAVPVVVAPKEVEEAAKRVPISSPPPALRPEKEKEYVRKRVDTQETAKATMGDSFVTVAPPPPPPASTSSGPEPEPEDPHASSRATLNAFLSSSYADSTAWSTYHAEKVRKCALSSLDPSMLLGFLVQGEEDWRGFRRGVEELFHSSAPIFSIANSPPRWMRRTTSASVPPPSGSSPSAADDSFDDLAASPVLSARTAEGEEGAERAESSTGFSEPDDWELDSTDGLSESPSPSGAESSSGGKTPAVVEERWDEAAQASSPSSSPLDAPAVVVDPPATKREKELDAEGWEGV